MSIATVIQAVQQTEKVNLFRWMIFPYQLEKLSNSTAANGTKTSTSLLAGIPKGTAATITITLPKEYRVAKCYFHTLAGRSTSTSTFTEKKLLKYQNTTFQYNLEQQVQGDNRIATLTFTVSDSSFTDPNDALLKAITQKLVSYFEIEQATTKVTFYPVPGDNSKKIEKTACRWANHRCCSDDRRNNSGLPHNGRLFFYYGAGKVVH